MPKYNLKSQIKLSHYFWNENDLKPEAFLKLSKKIVLNYYDVASLSTA